MDWLMTLLSWVLHLDVHLAQLTTNYGMAVYVILFAVIFSETGFVVTPFLPGDSLLFVAGALAAIGGLDLTLLITTLLLAALLGNMVNYQVGAYLGPKVFQWENSRFFNREALHKTHDFYQRHGGKTLILSRFLPFFRTFAPFVAGIGRMHYPLFFFYNLVGALAWVVSLCLAGYWFGNIPWVKNNLTLVIVAMLLIPSLPAIVTLIRHRAAANRPPPEQKTQ